MTIMTIMTICKAAAHSAAIGLVAIWMSMSLHAQAVPSAGQAYPTRPIRLIVPWPPGGGSDVIARIVAPRVSEGLRQQVVVDNRAGAASIIGLDLVAKAPPDGYTIGFATSNLAVNPSLYPKLPFALTKDLSYVTLLATGVYVLVVHPSVPAKSVNELIGLVKTAPRKYNASLTGAGSPSHLGLAKLNAMLGTSLTGVTYKGGGPAAAALAGGEVQVMFMGYPTVAPLIQAGRMRLIAVTSAKRSGSLPDVPTMEESGLPGFVLDEWYGIVAPANVGQTQMSRLNDQFRRALAIPEVRDRLSGLGAEVVGSSPEEFRTYVRDEMTKWGKIIKDAGIKAEQ